MNAIGFFGYNIFYMSQTNIKKELKYGEDLVNISLVNQQIVNYNQNLLKQQASSARFALVIKKFTIY
jgi:hypothetical protein